VRFTEIDGFGGISKDDFGALWGALVLRDGLTGGAMPFETGYSA
jgi:hypothetical protein